MREPIRIVIQPDDVVYAKEKAGDKQPVFKELAALAGSIYLFGGKASYMLSRFEGRVYDVKRCNVKFIANEVAKKEDIWNQVLSVRAAERRKGFVYIGMAVSPIVNMKAVVLVCGYYHDVTSIESDRKKDLSIPFPTLTAPLPLFHQGVTDGRQDIDWPIKGLKGSWKFRPESDARRNRGDHGKNP